jgi:hypothetical protein
VTNGHMREGRGRSTWKKRYNFTIGDADAVAPSGTSMLEASATQKDTEAWGAHQRLGELRSCCKGAADFDVSQQNLRAARGSIAVVEEAAVVITGRALRELMRGTAAVAHDVKCNAASVFVTSECQLQRRSTDDTLARARMRTCCATERAVGMRGATC